jgi:hypothetical protein
MIEFVIHISIIINHCFLVFDHHFFTLTGNRQVFQLLLIPLYPLIILALKKEKYILNLPC